MKQLRKQFRVGCVLVAVIIFSHPLLVYGFLPTQQDEASGMRVQAVTEAVQQEPKPSPRSPLKTNAVSRIVNSMTSFLNQGVLLPYSGSFARQELQKTSASPVATKKSTESSRLIPSLPSPESSQKVTENSIANSQNVTSPSAPEHDGEILPSPNAVKK